MAAGNYDIIIDKGATYSVTLTVKDGSAPKNLSEYSIRGKMKANLQASHQTYSFDFSDTTADDKTNGTIRMKLAHDVVANNNTALVAGSYFYDVEIYKGSEGSETEVTRLIQGKATVRDEVTL
jgi:hypothetical protein